MRKRMKINNKNNTTTDQENSSVPLVGLIRKSYSYSCALCPSGKWNALEKANTVSVTFCHIAGQPAALLKRVWSRQSTADQAAALGNGAAPPDHRRLPTLSRSSGSLSSGHPQGSSRGLTPSKRDLQTPLFSRPQLASPFLRSSRTPPGRKTSSCKIPPNPGHPEAIASFFLKTSLKFSEEQARKY